MKKNHWRLSATRLVVFFWVFGGLAIFAIAGTGTFQLTDFRRPTVRMRPVVEDQQFQHQQGSQAGKNLPVISATTKSVSGDVSIEGPGPDPNQSVWIQGQAIDQWTLGSYQVYQLIDVNCRQGELSATASNAIVWIDHNSNLPDFSGADVSQNSAHVAVVYLEGNVNVNYLSGRDSNGKNSGVERADQWFHSYYSYSDIAVRRPSVVRTVGISMDRQLRHRALSHWRRQTAKSDRIAADNSMGRFQSSSSRDSGTNQGSNVFQNAAAFSGGTTFPATQVVGTERDQSFNAPASFSRPSPQQSPPNSIPVTQIQGYQPSHTPAALGNPNFGLPNLQTGNGQIPPQNTHPAYQNAPNPGGVQQTQRQPSASFGYGTSSTGTSSGQSGTARTDVGSNAPSQIQRVQVFPRSTAVDLNVQNVPGRVPGEQMILGTGGVKVVISSKSIQNSPLAVNGGQSLIVQADNFVAWTNQVANLGGSPDAPRWELFLEGNVIFSIGNRVVNATKMYYDVNRQVGVILDVEMLTPVPEYDGLVRMRADVLHQVNQNQFQAHQAAVTTSRIGKPRYWLQSNTLNLTRNQTVKTDPITGITPFDPQTGRPATTDSFSMESRNNYIYLWGRPILYWPVFRTKLEQPEYYLRGLSVKNDSVFGFQFLTDWNMYQVLGKDPIEGTDWTGGLDYLSQRGLAIESVFSYNRQRGFYLPGRIEGRYDTWFLFNDKGVDNLGLDRRTLVPEESSRGRSLWTHRTHLDNGDRIIGQMGWISDRNFLEQFYEAEWDQRHDQYTNIAWERVIDNRRFSVLTQGNFNDFFTQTQWLPKADYTLLGHSMFGGPWNFSTKAHVGYADLKVADAPTNAVDLAKFDPLAWEAEREGLRAGIRGEVSRPLQFGSMKVTPYALGDATYWGEDLNGNDISRLYGQVGIRTDLPMWKVDPSIRSEIWNLNGLAHKVNFYSHFFYADASQDLDEFVLFDPLDDDAQEHFRRRFAFDTFGIVAGGNVANRFDERFFALRSGVQSFVTSTANEIADDQTQFQFGVNQRWQTKRGAPGRQRVVDWISLDMKASLFPRENRDNFGETFGLAEFDFRWHIGDRLSLLADGYMDTYQDGLKTASVGMLASRPLLGDLYLGVRTIDGAFQSDVASAQVNYRLSPKWILKASTSWDFGNTGRIGQLFGAVYIGESFLWQVGTHTDFSRDNVGFVFSIEPRVLPKGKLGRLGGVTIPPPGILGLE